MDLTKKNDQAKVNEFLSVTSHFNFVERYVEIPLIHQMNETACAPMMYFIPANTL